MAVIALLAAAWVPAMAADGLTRDEARYLLTRTGFAPTEAEVAQYAGKSRQQAVDALLSGTAYAARTPPPTVATAEIVPFHRLANEMERAEERRRQIVHSMELRSWWLREMIETPTPLTERMTLFWHNHFATSQQKVRYTQLMYQQNRLLREHALGNFRQMLHAVSKDPAMLIYLDGANNRKEAPNENFAREVMELFVLGEASQGGNYTEQDIKEAAKAFTGWSLEREDFTYRFRPALHDTGEKTVFGRRGNFTGEQVLDMMLAKPEAANFIVGKLWREFVSPEPQSAEHQRIAAAFRASNYDIKVAMRELLLTPAFWDARNRGSLVKSPTELLVGTMRQFGFGYSDTLPLAIRSASMGQNLLAPPNVKGWPGGTAWINSTTLLDRKRMLEQLFRAIEMPDQQTKTMLTQQAMAQTMEMRSNRELPKGAAAMRQHGMLRFAEAQANIWFDGDAWLKQYGAYLDREPSVTARLAMQKALLPLEPAHPMPSGTVGLAYLRQLVMDPVYQLK
jgi:uncharacterized protein (DUF1800 family)